MVPLSVIFTPLSNLPLLLKSTYLKNFNNINETSNKKYFKEIVNPTYDVNHKVENPYTFNEETPSYDSMVHGFISPISRVKMNPCNGINMSNI